MADRDWPGMTAAAGLIATLIAGCAADRTVAGVSALCFGFCAYTRIDVREAPDRTLFPRLPPLYEPASGVPPAPPR